ncbi:response regulator receiver protein [Sulfobacillus acidophilus TPY]|nr:response regulator receiver protein [Sulfobacillus acidophilus TPY]
METRIVLAQLVKLAGGRVVAQASSAAEALEWLRNHRVDLVITDYQMPECRGDELAVMIRQSWPTTRIALVSVRHDADLTEKAQDAGVDWILAKPVGISTMEAIIRSVAGPTSRIRADEDITRQFGDQGVRSG